MNAFQEGWKNYKNLWTAEKYICFKGRASRSEYWTTILITVLFSIGAYVLDIIFGAITDFDMFSIFSTIYSLAMFFPLIGLSFRRLHDVGRSGWWKGVEYIIAGVASIFCLSLVMMGLWATVLYDFQYGLTHLPSYLIGNFTFTMLLLVAYIVLKITNFIFTLLRGQDAPNKYGDVPVSHKKHNIEDVTYRVIPNNSNNATNDLNNSSDDSSNTAEEDKSSDNSGDNYII